MEQKEQHSQTPADTNLLEETLRLKLYSFIEETLKKTFSHHQQQHSSSLLNVSAVVGNGISLSHRETQLKFESFKMETASRKVLQELLEYFTQRDRENEDIIKDIQEQSGTCVLKVDQFEKVIKRVQQQSLEQEQINKKMTRLEQKVDQTIARQRSKEDQIDDKFKAHQSILENKMQILTHYDQRMSELDKEVAEVRQLAHTFRDKLVKDQYELQRTFNLLDEKVNYECEKFASTHDQQRTLILSFKDKIAQLEQDYAILKKSHKFMQEKHESELDRRIIVEDFKRGMRQMNEFLLHKFYEVDALQEAYRDVATYVKLYLPVKVQMQVNESLSYLVGECVASKLVIDQDKFFINQSTRFEGLMTNLENVKAQMLNDPSLLMKQQQQQFGLMSEAIVKQALKKKKDDYSYRTSQEFIEPFLRDLIKFHEDESKSRASRHSKITSYRSTAEKLRKYMTYNEMRDLIEIVEAQSESHVTQDRKQTQAKPHVGTKIIPAGKTVFTGGNNTGNDKSSSGFRGIAKSLTMPQQPVIKLNSNNVTEEIQEINIENKIEAEVKDEVLEGGVVVSKGVINNEKVINEILEERKEEGSEFKSILNKDQTDREHIYQNTPQVTSHLLNQEKDKSDSQNNKELIQQDKAIQSQETTEAFKPSSKLKSKFLLKTTTKQQQQPISDQPSIQPVLEEQNTTFTKPTPTTKRLVNQQQPQQILIENKFTIEQFEPNDLSPFQKHRLAKILLEELFVLLEASIDLRVTQGINSLNGTLRQLELNIEGAKTQLNERYRKEFDSCTRQFKEMMDGQIERWGEEMRIMHKQKARDKNDLELMVRKIDDKVECTMLDIQNQLAKTQSYQGTLNNLVEISKLSLVCQQADLNDRFNTSLYGIKNRSVDQQQNTVSTIMSSTLNENSVDSTINRQQNPFKLDQKCLTCQVSGHDTQHIKHLFKMACLSFAPSKVQYEGENFTREELFQKQRDLLYQQTKHIDVPQMFVKEEDSQLLISKSTIEDNNPFSHNLSKFSNDNQILNPLTKTIIKKRNGSLFSKPTNTSRNIDDGRNRTQERQQQLIIRNSPKISSRNMNNTVSFNLSIDSIRHIGKNKDLEADELINKLQNATVFSSGPNRQQSFHIGANNFAQSIDTSRHPVFQNIRKKDQIDVLPKLAKLANKSPL